MSVGRPPSITEGLGKYTPELWERQADMLRKLVAAGVPLIAAHPASLSMLLCYELDMIRHDTGCPMFPYLPDALHPARQQLATFAAGGPGSPLGDLEQIAMERAVEDKEASQILMHLTRDTELLRELIHDVWKVSALATPTKESPYANLGVQLSSPSGMLARWSVGPADQYLGARIVMSGTRGAATLTMPSGVARWQLEVQGDSPQNISFPEFSAPHEAIRRLGLVIEGEAIDPDWTSACRDAEVADRVVESLRRGRTIELLDEERSEESTFKGLMAIGGCAILTFSAFILILIATLSGQLTPLGQHGFWDRLPIYLACLLAIFLGLQLLMLVFPRDSRDGPRQ